MDNEEQLVGLWERFGWASIPVIVVVVGIRLYRIPEIQDSLAPSWRWDRLPMAARIALVFAASLAMSLASSLIAGQTLIVGLLTAIPVAISAIATHKATKAIGHGMQSRKQEGNPFYTPSPFRKASSLVIPLNHKNLIKPIPPDRR